MVDRKQRGRPKKEKKEISKKTRGRPKNEIKDDNFMYSENSYNSNDNCSHLMNKNINGVPVLCNLLNNDMYTANGTFIGSYDFEKKVLFANDNKSL